jgi:hypothetical protein
MPKGRTGIIPGKKNFTAVGGVGAKRTPIRNLINAQALAPTSNIASIGIASILSPSAPPPPIIPTAVIAAIETAKNPPPPIPPTPLTPLTPLTSPILFDLSSFDRSFDVDGEGFILQGPPGFIGPPALLPLSQYTDGLFPDARRGRYYKALCRAAARWAHFLKFTPEMITAIRKIKPNWNGIELTKFKSVEGHLGNDWASNCKNQILVSGTSMIVGFQIEVNYYYTKDYTESDIFHLLTHELGHALGMPPKVVKDNTVELFPNKYNQLDYDGKMKYFYRGKYFPRAYAAYRERYEGITRREKTKELAKEEYDDLIPLQNVDGNHWNETAVIIPLPMESAGWPEKLYRGIRNDILSAANGAMQTRYPYSTYFITKITLGELCDLYFKEEWLAGDGVSIYNYIECHPFGNGEVTSHDLNFAKDCIYFDGKTIDPLKKGIKKSNKEEEDETCCAIRQNCYGCKQIYLDACGECS